MMASSINSVLSEGAGSYGVLKNLHVTTALPKIITLCDSYHINGMGPVARNYFRNVDSFYYPPWAADHFFALRSHQHEDYITVV